MQERRGLIEPVPQVPLQIDQFWCANVGRLHPLHDGVPGQLGANSLAYDRGRSINSLPRA
jgi:hypothetical protein